MAFAVLSTLDMKLFGVRASLGWTALLTCFSGGNLAFGQGFQAREVAAEANANTRYVVEAVQISGESGLKLSRTLQAAFEQLVGSHFDPAQLSEVSRQMRRELHLKSVTPHLIRGSQPDMVCIDFEVQRRAVVFDVTLPKFLYHSKQGWSAEGTASTTVARYNRLTFGLVSDGGTLTERYAGSAVSYENTHVGTDRVHLAFEFDQLHQQWNRATLMALNRDPNDPQTYRDRRNFQPSITILLARPLILQAGGSFQQLQMQPAPGSTEPDRSANALFATLRYHRIFEGSNQTQQVAVDYNIRSAKRAFSSDYAYTRHLWGANYTLTRGNQTFQDDFTAGFLTGQSPFFERFVVGTNSLLRGWNRFEIDPLGGTRLVHNSVTYRYRLPVLTGQVFYDAGALWHGKGDSGIRHSLGVGVSRSIFTLAVAFPVREGRIDPVFMVGMNY
jgi:outer membrane protein assembly factor BamA